MRSESKRSFRVGVFAVPWLALVTMLAVSLVGADILLRGLDFTTSFILDNFGWLFNWSTFIAVILIVYLAFSPLGSKKVGGDLARPVMKFRSLVWITLCTTIAAGILFWACAEPLYHLHQPPAQAGGAENSPAAMLFAMKAMFLEWTWSPYALYTVATVSFAFAFHNMRLPHSLSSGLVPIFGEGVLRFSGVIDAVCLTALGLGMAASLGTGALSIAGGIENQFGIESGPVSWAIIIFAIVLCFVISSVSGVMRGIRKLSELNMKVYLVIFAFVLIFGPTAYIFSMGTESLGAFFADFPKMSLAMGTAHGEDWNKTWPIFYWCNWLAWTPITATFLASIAKGFTFRRLIVANFILPSLFSSVWMAIFSSSAIYFDKNGVNLWEAMQDMGPESVVYGIFEQMPLAVIVIPVYLFIVFISFVTASDSNTTAVADICMPTYRKTPASKHLLKVVWGATVGAVTWIVISFGGIDGIKMASNLGGFPNLFLFIGLGSGVAYVSRQPERFYNYFSGQRPSLIRDIKYRLSERKQQREDEEEGKEEGKDEMREVSDSPAL